MNGNMGNMNKLMKQMQKLQEDILRTQEELRNKTVEAAAGGGVVKAEVNGHRELVGLSIDPEVVDPEDVKTLEDLIVAAVRAAMEKADQMAQQELGKVTGGLNIPGIPGLPGF